MVNDTSKAASEINTNIFGDTYTAYKSSDALATDVEFWKWLDRNFSKSDIFSSNESMNDYISLGKGKRDWFEKQIQGKGYEWDWMQEQRHSFKNLFKRYDAGDVANRAASDVTQMDLLTGKTKEYQMKAYTSKTNPELKNTPKASLMRLSNTKVNTPFTL